MDDYMNQAEEQVRQADGQTTNKLKFLPASQLCSAPIRTDWIIKPYLDKNSLTVLFGEPGSMKTFVAIDQGLSVATNTKWQGQAIRQCGLVFYIAGEGFSGISKRVKAWAIAQQIDLENVPFYVSDRPAQFLDEDSALNVVARADELRVLHGDPVLVIVDTLNRNFGPGDENSTADMTRFVSAIDEHIRTRYGCAVMLVHHSGLTNTERARGAGALRGALDWEYRLKKNSNGTKILHCTKAKDHEPPPDITFKHEIITIDGWIDPDDNEPITSLVLRFAEAQAQDQKPLTGARKIAFDALFSIGEDYVHIDTWRDAAYSAGVSPSPEIKAKQKAFKRAVTDLLVGGHVKTKDDFYCPNQDRGHRETFRRHF